MTLYVDEETGKSIITHSMLKTGKRCRRQAMYKYADRLKPRRTKSPLKRGTWMHSLLEYHHSGQDWRKKHAELSKKFGLLFDEEKDYYGDMPTECREIMDGYLWHYKEDPWIVHEVEFTLECEFPDGTIYRGRVDALIENEHGLWLVDHKTHKRFPNFAYRLLDAQSGLYMWAARECGIPVQGFIWNYVRTVSPSKPKMVQDGSRLYKKMGETTYPVYVTELRRLKAEEGFAIRQEHLDYANILKGHRYKHGEVQVSPFFQRKVLEKDDAMLDRVAKEAFRTARMLNEYDFTTDRDEVERSVEMFSCEKFCDYRDLCTIELMGGNTNNLLKQNFKVEDPQSYYYDQREDPDQDQD